MIPVWVFGIFIVLFIAIEVWGRVNYKNLENQYEGISFFLDLYIREYGPSIVEKNSIEVDNDDSTEY